MKFSPASLDFGIVAPGTGVALSTQSAAEFINTVAVTASIVDDSSGGAFSVATVQSLVLVTEYESDPGVRGGKPVKVTTLETVAHSDGITPLQVSKGQLVAVQIGYLAASQEASDKASATLQIDGGGSTIASIPLTAEVGEIAIDIPPITIRQMQTMSVQATVQLIAGGATEVLLSTDAGSNPNLPPGVSYLPPGIYFNVTNPSVGTPVPVTPAKPSAPITLVISATLAAAPGSYNLVLNTSAFNGTMHYYNVPVTVTPLTLQPSSFITQKYAALGGPQSFLGPSKSAIAFCDDDYGQYQEYLNGVIYWAGPPATEAFEVHGPILDYILWQQSSTDPNSPPARQPASTGPFTGLGYPRSDVSPIIIPLLNFNIGSVSQFDKGSIFWSPSVGTHAIGLGPIRDRWLSEGGPMGRLGFPLGRGGVEPMTKNTWVEFENGVLYPAPLGGIAESRINKNGTRPNGYRKEYILDQLSQQIQKQVAAYNARKPPPDYPVNMNGGPTFVDPNNPATDYWSQPSVNSPEWWVRNRMYYIRQEFFAQSALGDIYIDATFNLLTDFGGPTTTVILDAKGNPKEVPVDNSLLMTVQNVVVNAHSENPGFTHDKQQQAQQQVQEAFSQARNIKALPDGVPFVSVKVYNSDDPDGLFANGDLAVLYIT